MSSRSLLASTLCGAAALAISACSPADDAPSTDSASTAEDTGNTLAGVLNAMAGTDRVREALEEAGLVSLLDGSGAYTLLAPDDAAFEALGEPGERLIEDDQRPFLIGLLRAHILPGTVTIEAIEAALDRQGGSVEMTTLGGGTVTFSRDDDDARTIIVTGPDGVSARLSGSAVAASNGAVLPIDRVLGIGVEAAPSDQ